jgi:tRNA pseudouridine38-40 synthase
MKNNVKLILSYDGTDYFGFQTQLSGNTIADKLIRAVEKINGCKTEIRCAGRTDTGVHAEGQVVNFFTENTRMNEDNWLQAINSILPHDIRVLKSEIVDENFDARNSAFYREYWYHIMNSYSISALDNRYAIQYKYPMNIELLKSYCPVMLGEQNFTSFSAITDQSISKKRFVHKAEIEKNNDLVIFKIIANAFLHKMIRTVIGTFLILQKENRPASDLKRIIEAKDRNMAGPTFSPKGLVLKKVYYEEIE